MQAIGLGIGVKFGKGGQLMVRLGGVVRLHERLERGLPVGRVDHPLPPLVAHLVEFEVLEDAARITQKLLKAFAVIAHVDIDEPAPGIDPHRRQRGAFRIKRTVPVIGIENIGVGAFKIVGPTVKGTDEIACLAAHAVAGHRRIHQLPPAMRTDIVKRADCFGPGAHDDDRIVADVIGKEIADFGNVFQPPGHLPDFGPQPLLFGRGIIGRQERFGAVGDCALCREVFGGYRRIAGMRKIGHRALLRLSASCRPGRPGRAIRPTWFRNDPSHGPSRGTAPICCSWRPRC